MATAVRLQAGRGGRAHVGKCLLACAAAMATNAPSDNSKTRASHTCQLLQMAAADWTGARRHCCLPQHQTQHPGMRNPSPHNHIVVAIALPRGNPAPQLLNAAARPTLFPLPFQHIHTHHQNPCCWRPKHYYCHNKTAHQSCQTLLNSRCERLRAQAGAAALSMHLPCTAKCQWPLHGHNLRGPRSLQGLTIRSAPAQRLHCATAPALHCVRCPPQASGHAPLPRQGCTAAPRPSQPCLPSPALPPRRRRSVAARQMKRSVAARQVRRSVAAE
jgi:hypothetical protein